ncbi:hypothetical protein [uncultured Tateyamaria sp.]|uniref:SPOR domain-containing protein n=1 Tax=uncultured Tateyamaria sp. TaxID=455651 RepID=UPI002628A74D|nr:hypothetical protein [uncultured Tateyamaria sp.]
MMNRLMMTAALVAVLGCPAAALGLDMDTLPDPTHLQKVLDVDEFLGQQGVGVRYVQVAAFRQRQSGYDQIERINEVGLKAQLGRLGSWYLVLMPETQRNSAEVLRRWARRSGYPDAFIRKIR